MKKHWLHNLIAANITWFLFSCDTYNIICSC